MTEEKINNAVTPVNTNKVNKEPSEIVKYKYTQPVRIIFLYIVSIFD